MAGKDNEQGREPNGEEVDEEIRRRAYEISQSPDAGTPEDNWHRAARELGQHDSTALTNA